jgi:hypothetical protein
MIVVVPSILSADSVRLREQVVESEQGCLLWRNRTHVRLAQE